MHDSNRKAAEYHTLAAHTHHTAAEHRGQEDHLTGHEYSRQALEHSSLAHQHSFGVHQKDTMKPSVIVPTEDGSEGDIAVRAYKLWQARQCPEGSPQEDWFRAVEALRRGN